MIVASANHCSHKTSDRCITGKEKCFGVVIAAAEIGCRIARRGIPFHN